MQEYLTSQFAGTGGNIKLTPEDFYVEEIPAYLPVGEGEHLYLWIEKRNCSTMRMAQILAEKLQLKPADIGYAGLKDKRATTRQWVSVSAPPSLDENTLSALDLGADIKILSVKRHSNKLRLGHLRGNRFKLNIHDVVPDALERAQNIIHVLEHTGVPNLFGAQRYGARANNHIVGGAILRADFTRAAQEIIGTPATISNIHWQKAAQAFADGDLDTAVTVMPRHLRDERRLLQALRGGASPKKAVLSMGKKMLRLYLSAYQSHFFDRQVQMRLNSLDTLWAGDIANIHANGACFRVENPEAEQARADAFEISPTGLMPGKKAMLANDQTGVLEAALLEKEAMPLENYSALNGLQVSAERRPLRIRAEGISCSMEDNILKLEFSLPSGSYATSLLREITKTP